METCENDELRDYYVKSALHIREQIRLLELQKEKLIDLHSAAEIQSLSIKVFYLLQEKTKDEQQDFKNKLILYYECGSTNTKTIKCMIMNKYFDRGLVRAAPIWKAATHGVGLTEFRLEEADVNNERNGLLLFESVEKAFDSKNTLLHL
ncbi:unnamed protein product [Didymodactylos carnosus]|uniref:Uncharacterized protein n=1 Tax=Didymodactylos carnosus TaxID=1234261 RepID=A0A815I3B7_9BILA|nr:unnamed protein product [Didymodactylos carnosus]CAF4237556.1 unnamed protein product [Didymodactylos carnosus]